MKGEGGIYVIFRLRLVAEIRVLLLDCRHRGSGCSYWCRVVTRLWVVELNYYIYIYIYISLLPQACFILFFRVRHRQMPFGDRRRQTPWNDEKNKHRVHVDTYHKYRALGTTPDCISRPFSRHDALNPAKCVCAHSC